MRLVAAVVAVPRFLVAALLRLVVSWLVAAFATHRSLTLFGIVLPLLLVGRSSFAFLEAFRKLAASCARGCRCVTLLLARLILSLESAVIQYYVCVTGKARPLAIALAALQL